MSSPNSARALLRLDHALQRLDGDQPEQPRRSDLRSADEVVERGQPRAQLRQHLLGEHAGA